MREESFDPGLVDEVEGSGEYGEEEDIQKDAVPCQFESIATNDLRKEHSHLRIEDAGSGLDNSNSLIKSLYLVNGAVFASHDCNQVQS